MSFNRAIWYTDLRDGSDAARTPLAGCDIGVPPDVVRGEELCPGLTSGFWTPGSNWGFGTDPARLIGTSSVYAQYVSCKAAITTGGLYLLSFTVSALTGQWRFKLGNNQVDGTTQGQFTYVLLATSTQGLSFTGNLVPTSYVITDVSLRRITDARGGNEIPAGVFKASHGLSSGAAVTVPAGAFAGDYLCRVIDDDHFTLHGNPSEGWIEMLGIPLEGEGIRIGDRDFTFRELRADQGEITLSGDMEELTRNMATAINTDCGSAVLAYFANNAMFSDMYRVIYLLAKVPGTTGNYITLGASSPHVKFSGPSLSGGTNLGCSTVRNNVALTPMGGGSWQDALRYNRPVMNVYVNSRYVNLVRKSDPPQPIGAATFTDLSRVVTLEPLPGCLFADSEAGTVRVGREGHGYGTGAVIAVSGTNGGIYDGTYSITVVSPSAFDLDGVQYSADSTGTVTPSFTSVVSDCETAWVAASGAVSAMVAAATDAKSGNGCIQVTAPAQPAAGTLYAYFGTGVRDLSPYRKITFWVKNEAVLADDQTWRICLCSDASGLEVAYSFPVPAIPSTGNWTALTLGGNGPLGGAIRSVALYSGATLPAPGKYVRIDNISACTENGLNLHSLISKSSDEQGFGDELQYPLQSINGNTLAIDNHVNCKAGQGRGYSTWGAATQTVTAFRREPIVGKLTNQTGHTGCYLYQGTYVINGMVNVTSGGWNPLGTVQDGVTAVTGSNGYSCLLGNWDFNAGYCDRFLAVRFCYGYYTGANTRYTFARDISLIACSSNPFGSYTPFISIFRRIKASNNATYLLTPSSYGTLNHITACNNMDYGLVLYLPANGIRTRNNGTASLAPRMADIRVRNSRFSESVPINSSGYGFYQGPAALHSLSHDMTAGNNRVIGIAGESLIHWQTLEKHPDDAGAWSFRVLASNQEMSARRLKICEGLFEGGVPYTISARIRKLHATNVAAAVYIDEQEGIPFPVYAIKDSNTLWEDVSIRITPTATSVIVIHGIAFYAGNVTNAVVYFGRIKIEQNGN